ncbi:unnamed protein product, partial [Iphiclides podalirius]
MPMSLGLGNRGWQKRGAAIAPAASLINEVRLRAVIGDGLDVDKRHSDWPIGRNFARSRLRDLRRGSRYPLGPTQPSRRGF